ncbi:hypothetical protein HYV10_03890 [Candidatus Dependentiae bacterium]|nr:hypothetical protein [Candidatus Dependentiae bacterium]
MLIKSKNLFFSILILSIGLSGNDNNLEITQTESMQEKLSEEIQKTEETEEVEEIQKSEATENIKTKKILDIVQKKYRKIIDVFLKSDRSSKIVDQLAILKENPSINFNIDKIGLVTAIFASLSLLACNRLTKPGRIRSNQFFKGFSYISYGYLTYRLVSTNNDVKRDICKTLEKIKKD